MRIAVVGWGSLIWSPRSLAHDGRWREGGPRLPIEFSRISPDGRLTLVIDPVDGTPVTTLWTLSSRSSIDEAVADLAAREGCDRSGIGFLDRPGGEHSRRRHPDQPDVTATIDAWSEPRGMDGAVWTALPTTFEARTGRAFSPERALGYLDSLEGGLKEKAIEYVRNAPRQVDTPVRRAFASDGRFGHSRSGRGGR